ncbi:MAG TPA: hypothetical protein VF708_14700 [Pyrinomonadaceae bacterium]|jgi:hypothetical protein
MMSGTRKIFSLFGALIVVAAISLSALATTASPLDSKSAKDSESASINAPLNLAILIQDNLVSRVGNEMNVTRDFIRQLPAGSRVMVGYITSGTLQVLQPFTDDLEQAAHKLRTPRASASLSPYNPYVEVLEALKHFENQGQNRNAILLISDGLDISRGFDVTSSVNSIDLERAIREAKRRNVAVYSFFAPSVGLTSRNLTAISFGQGALNRLSDETGGRAFFQGNSFVTFDSYFKRLRRTLNEAY